MTLYLPIALASIASAQTYSRETEIDFEVPLEVTATIPKPLVLVSEPPTLEEDRACADLLAEGLPELPTAAELATPAGRRELRAAARSDGLSAEAAEVALAKAWTCFEWTYGDADDRTTTGLYAWFVREADLGYCRERFGAYRDVTDPRDAWTALDDAAATAGYCLVDDAAPPLARDPFEKAQTALSEAKLGTYLPGGAADLLYRRVARKVEVSPDAFLAVLRDIDASGAPAAEFLAGERDRVWKSREIAREAVERLSSGS